MKERATESGPALARSLSMVQLIAIVMGAIIGVGIFFTPKKVVAITGDGGHAIAAWVVGGLIALMGSLTFAELGGLFPRTGGQYVVLRRAYGRLIGFLYSWALLTVIQTGAIAIIAIICVEYLAEVLGVSVGRGAITAWSIVLIVGLALMNVWGVRQGAGVATVTSVLKAVTLLTISALGLFAADGGGEAPAEAVAAAATSPSPWIVIPALVPVLFAFGGWQQGLYLGGEVKNPERVLPRGIIIGVSSVVVLYVLVNLGYLRLLGVEGMQASNALAADAVETVAPGIAGRIAGLAVAISAFGVASVCTMTAPRMYKAMADDGCFFAAFGRIHPRFGTPALALLLQGAVTVGWVLAGKGRVDSILNGVVCIDWVFFALTGLALFRLRRLVPEERPFRVPGYPVVPGLFTLAAVGVVVATFVDASTREASIIAATVLALGVVAFSVFRAGTR